MFLILSFLALIFYTGNSVGFTTLARKYRLYTWELTTWRGILLGLLTALWLIFSTPDSWFISANTVILLAVVMGLSGNVATIANFESVKILPLGICTGLSRLSVIPTFVLGYYLQGEILLLSQYIGGAIIIIAGILMSPAISKNTKNTDNMDLLGVFWIIIRICMHGVWYFCLGYLARGTDPWFATFVGEFSQVPFIFAFIMSQKKRRYNFFALSVHIKEILPVCFFAFLATPCFAYAMEIGNIGVATVIVSMIGVTTSLYGRFFWKESLLGRQWLGVIISVIGLVVLNIHKF